MYSFITNKKSLSLHLPFKVNPQPTQSQPQRGHPTPEPIGGGAHEAKIVRLIREGFGNGINYAGPSGGV